MTIHREKCPECGNKIVVYRDGTFVTHTSIDPKKPQKWGPCPGSGKKVEKVTGS